MSAHKKQHFIPRCYLAAWTDPSTPEGQEPYVWLFPRDGGTAKKRAPSNIFHETDMYTIRTPDGGRDLILERGLSELESRFVDVRTALEDGKPLNAEARVMLCAFVAAMHTRTPTMREHQREQWKQPLDQMERMMEQMKTATPKEKRRLAKHSDITRPPKGALYYEDVKRLVEAPMATMLPVMIAAETPQLARLDLAVFCATDSLGFITSDHPCIWHDSEAYKRPPFYRSPALMYPTIEITLPVSPRRCILLGRQGTNGFFEANSRMMDEINRRTRFGCEEYFVVCRNEQRNIWFDPGKEPADSWENVQRQKQERADSK